MPCYLLGAFLFLGANGVFSVSVPKKKNLSGSKLVLTWYTARTRAREYGGKDLPGRYSAGAGDFRGLGRLREMGVFSVF